MLLTVFPCLGAAIVAVAFVYLVVAGNANAADDGLTTMPHDIPGDPNQYLNKWDPLALKPLIGTRHSLSRNNSRQIARDIMLDASGKVVICYSQQDSVYYLPVGGKAETAAANANMPPLTGSEVFHNALTGRTDTAAPGVQTTARRRRPSNAATSTTPTSLIRPKSS